MNVNLTPHFENFVESQIETGRYTNASEVIRDGLRLLEEHQQLHEAKLRDLRAALDEGENSPDVPFDIEKIIERGKERRARNQSRGRHV
jgi:antitoxin ParD1/3/4